jgi:hypothetical protein
MSKIINTLKQLFTFAPQRTSLRSSDRPSTFGLLLTFSLIISSCGLDVEDPTPPSPPVWVQKSLPEEWPERGIDAHESGRILLEWNTVEEADIAEYFIYRAIMDDVADSLEEFELLEIRAVPSLDKTEYIDVTARTEIQYWYKIQAKDIAGNLSSYSDSICYTLLPFLQQKFMTPDGVDDTLGIDRNLSWLYTYNNAMENYCITVLSAENELVVRQVFQPGNYVGATDTWQIPDNILLDSNKIYNWRIDVAAQYHDQREKAGSESTWATFLYVGE